MTLMKFAVPLVLGLIFGRVKGVDDGIVAFYITI